MQVAALDVPGELPDLFKFRKSLNALLRPGIGVRSVSLVDGSFHPAYAAKSKVYRYRIWNADWDHPIFAPYVWRTLLQGDFADIETGLKAFQGEHDFSSFCAADSSAKTRVRRVLNTSLRCHGPLCDLWIQGEGFLKQMVRNIVGTLVDINHGRFCPDSVPQILATCDRKKAGRTAPAQGLCLVHVDFERVTPLEQVIQSSESGFSVAI
jgi:tRNA pseudouridine38-40 synthase